MYNLDIYTLIYACCYAGQFRVLECMETSDGAPVANFLLLESSKYPGHYLRWYDNRTVDCQVWINMKKICIS